MLSGRLLWCPALSHAVAASSASCAPQSIKADREKVEREKRNKLKQKKLERLRSEKEKATAERLASERAAAEAALLEAQQLAELQELDRRVHHAVCCFLVHPARAAGNGDAHLMSEVAAVSHERVCQPCDCWRSKAQGQAVTLMAESCSPRHGLQGRSACSWCRPPASANPHL